MRTERFDEPQATGLIKLTGDNTGLVYTNERQEQVEETADDGSPVIKTVWIYDVYEVSDSRDPHKVKNDVISSEHPFGDETKILRKALAKLLKSQGLYDQPPYREFKAYNEFAESV